MLTSHPHVASLIFDRPLMIHPPKLRIIINAVKRRIGIDQFGDEEDDDNAEGTEPSDVSVQDGIACIPVYGTLVKRCIGMDAMSGLTSYESVGAAIMDAATDPNVRGILLDVDSYGGECAGAFDLSDLIYQVRKTVPVYAVVNSYGFSAGYAIASAAEKLYVTQDGGIGSIGVIAVHADQSELDGKIGVKYTAITYGDHKNDFSPHAALSDDAATELQADVNRLGKMFTSLVARNRGMSEDAVTATQARTYGAQEGVSLGLADYIGTKANALASLSQRVSGRRLVPMPGNAFAAAVATPVVPVTASVDGLISSGTISEAQIQAAAIQPVLEASASAAAITKEDTQVSQTIQADAGVGVPLQANQAEMEAAALGKAQAEMQAKLKQITALCRIAGKIDMLGGFLASGLSVEQVQEKLLASRADNPETELQTEVLPASEKTIESNRLLNAVSRRLKMQGLTEKVRAY